MNKLLILFAFCFNITAYAQMPENKTEDERIEEYLNKIEGLTLKEITEQFNSNIEMLEGVVDFFSKDDSEELKSISKENEEFEPDYIIDTTGVSKALNQFKKIIILQSYTSKKTNLKFKFVPHKFMGDDRLKDGIETTYLPRKIYYKNGTVKTDDIKDCEVDFYFSKDWGKPSPIDSIIIDYNINYSNKFETITLSKQTPKATYKGETIELLKMKDNYAYVRISNNITNFIKFQGQNTEGKTIKSYMSSSATQPLDQKNDFMKLMMVFMKKTQQKLNANKFESVAELKNYLIKKAKKLEVFTPTNFYYTDSYHSGNLDQVTLYFALDNVHKTTTFTAVNDNLNRSVIQVMDKNDLVFINQKEKELFRIKNKRAILEELTSNYFKDNNYFYYLNINKKRLDTLDVYNVTGYKKGLVSITKNRQSEHLTLFSNKNKPVSTSKYIWLDEYDDLLIGKKETGIYSINASGKETLLENVVRIKQGEEGMLIIQNAAGLMGYMNLSGEIIVPMQYRIVNQFSEGLAHVENTDHLIGFINTEGKTILPFKYDTAYKFIKGVTAVDYDGGFKLINKKGAIIFDSKSVGIGISTMNGERTYNLNGKRYNTKGELIIEEE